MDGRYYDPFTARDAQEWKDTQAHALRGGDYLFQGLVEVDGIYQGYFRYTAMPDGINNNFFFFIREEFLTDAIMEEVWTSVMWWMRKKGDKRVIWRSRQPFWLPYKEKLGGKKGNTGVCFRLYMKDVNREQLAQWIREGEMNTQGFTLVEQDFLQEKYVNDMAALADQLVRDMPREDSTIVFRSTPEDIRIAHQRNLEAGFKQHQLILLDPAGKMAGTTLILFKHPDLEIDQRITGVERSFRRRGLAKYLKALMLRNVLDRYPAAPAIRTECFALNIPMINLNKEMGYKVVANDVDHVFELT